MTVPEPIGTIVSRATVERAVIKTLQEWLGPVYLAHQERQDGLAVRSIPRPGQGEGQGTQVDKAIYGGLDFLTFDGELAPAVIVVVQPVDDAQYRAASTYDQWYEVQVAAICPGGDEDTARLRADVYGAAVMGVLTQQGNFGGLSGRTRLITAPSTAFVADNDRLRRVAQSVQTVHAFIQEVVTEGGPISPVSDGQTVPGPYVAENVELDLTVYPLGAPIPTE